MNTKNRNNASSDELYVRNWHGLIFEFYIIQEYQMMFDSYEQDICPDNMTAVELY